MEAHDLLAGLTKSQKEAVTHKDGPILVVAGAGTGKTTVITKRIAWLIQEKLAKPEEILALTFTEKAASEMLTRVDEISDYIYSGLSVSTFHSFGADLINEYAFELGLPADVRVLTDVEQILFIRDHIFEFEFKHYQNLSEPTSLIKELTKIFSRAKDEAILPDAWIKYAKKNIEALQQAQGASSNLEAELEEGEKQLEVANAYKVYDDLLKAEGYIDYGDQIMLVLELLKKPSCAKRIREQFKYAMVDEFQDTNFAQNELIFNIFGGKGNVMVVGDDDQSIYKFRGAAVSNILDFREKYQDVKTVVLADNFRSTQAILDSSYALIQNNNPDRLEAKYKIDKKLKSHLGEGEAPKLLQFETESQEAEAVAEEIIKLKGDGSDFSDIAILFRGNRQAEEFVRTLAKHGIPYIFSGAAGLYEKREVRMLTSLLKALHDPQDDLALFHLAGSEVYNMDADDLSQISRWSTKRNMPLSLAFADLEPITSQLKLDAETVNTGSEIVSEISRLREEAKTASAGEVINIFLRDSGFYAKLTREANQGSPEAHIKISNIAAFFDKVIHFQRNYKDHSLEKFASYLTLVMDVGDDPKSFEPTEGLDAVSVITIHKSKGLEFENVFVSSLSDSHMPGRGRSEKFELPRDLVKEKVGEESSDLAEERRLFYVAITRAKKRLYLTAALDYGTKKTHKISRFVAEALGDSVIEKRFLKTEPIERLRKFEKVPNLYNITLEPIPDDERLVLSRAAIDDWLTCPFKYQLVHVTPIRIVADANIAYGNAIHNSIGEYYKRRMLGKKVKIEEMMEWFSMFWDEAGFLSKTHERKRYEAGRGALKAFYARAEKEPLPESSEKEFKFAVGKNIIRGRFDAIFKVGDRVEIVDFKTSNVKKQDDADDRTKKSTQLATYALAWQAMTGKLPDSVHLYFVESGLIGNFVPTDKSAAKTEAEIEKAIEGIRARNYEATPQMFTCKYCPFKFYCPKAILEKTSS
jgi:DNA helicase II / ATP-dependent DNA helicase PcrA